MEYSRSLHQLYYLFGLQKITLWRFMFFASIRLPWNGIYNDLIGLKMGDISYKVLEIRQFDNHSNSLN